MRNRLIIFISIIWSAQVYSAIGIMGALDEEISLLKGEMELTEVDTIARRVFYKGSIENKDIVLVKAGVGKVNASLTAQILIDKFGIENIIFTGIAGAINPELNPGDIVISKQLSYHDFGIIDTGGFSSYDLPPIPADSLLIEIAKNVSKRIKFDSLPQEITGTKATLPKVFLGTIVTGDQFIASEGKRKWLEQTFGAYAVEMEGAAVAHVCMVNEIPFVVIRSMSDLANEKARIDIEKFKPYVARNSALIVKEILYMLGKPDKYSK